MDSNDRTPQDDIIDLIDIIEESDENVAPSREPKETPGDLDEFEDLFLFPGASEDTRSLLDEMDDDEGTDDDFPELDAIFEDLESTPEPQREAATMSRTAEPSPLASRAATIEEQINTLSDTGAAHNEITLAGQNAEQEKDFEGMRSRIAELQEQIPRREEIVQIAEAAAGEALAARLDQEETSRLSAESVQELVSASIREVTEPLRTLLEEQAGELARVNRELETVRDAGLTQEAMAAMIEQAVQEKVSPRDARISELESELAVMQDKLVAQEQHVPETPDMAALLQEMDARIEKAVPTAAARIIREEITALLKG